ncbi:MAG: vWA domain-containing protein, partial [Myxococcota bacterium]
MKSTLRSLLIGAALFTQPVLAGAPVPSAERVAPVAAAPKVQIALLLDTSGSMDGLLHQAKEQLWRIVNTFATAKHEERRPVLEIALYEYGKSSLAREAGFIRQIVPLTQDLDRVSEQLFALTTNGGDEYCGQVISKAVQQLSWSRSAKDLKLIYIAGNEPFTQGPVDYRKAVKTAVEKGITVNTIHCGPERDGVQGGWRDGAVLADGSFMTIDQNARIAHVEAPQDKEIARLGIELNKTYIGYGAAAPAAAERQARQDANAQGLSLGSSTQRALSKSSAFYDNSGWDLVDGTKKGKVKL